MVRRWSDRLLAAWVRLQVGLRGLWEDARGLQTLEWVALAIVILAFLGAIAYFFNQNKEDVGRAIWGTIKYFFESLTK